MHHDIISDLYTFSTISSTCISRATVVSSSSSNLSDILKEQMITLI